MRFYAKTTIILVISIIFTAAFAKTSKGYWVFQLGGFKSSQGEAQFVGIDGLIGNEYTVSQHHDYNILLGVGYYRNGIKKRHVSLAYGINMFYLPATEVKGNVIQEQLFNNLNYRYEIDHVPIYAAVKANLFNCKQHALTFDLGIGPSLMIAHQYREHSLDGITTPDNAFLSSTRIVFSATAGVGIKMNKVFGQIPLECGYRFFYLGQGQLNKRTNQLLNHMTTGKAYANAVLCAVNI